ncbi:MAG: hypothetical protein ACK2T7_05815 [Anaerolineales bacterium]
MKQLKLILLAASLLIVLTACSAAEPLAEPPADAAPPAYSLQGTWDYTFYYETDGTQDTYDLGTFTFTGSDSNGDLLMLNIYAVEYEGTYSVEGNTVLMQTTGETIQGTFTDATHLSGTWVSDENDVSGTWEAVKQ